MDPRPLRPGESAGMDSLARILSVKVLQQNLPDVMSALICCYPKSGVAFFKLKDSLLRKDFTFERIQTGNEFWRNINQETIQIKREDHYLQSVLVDQRSFEGRPTRVSYSSQIPPNIFVGRPVLVLDFTTEQYGAITGVYGEPNRVFVNPSQAIEWFISNVPD